MADESTGKKADVRFVASHGDRRFEIVAEPPVGFYVLVYHEGRCTHDYLQDTVEMAQRFAEHKFGVPLQSWRQPRE